MIYNCILSRGLTCYPNNKFHNNAFICTWKTQNSKIPKTLLVEKPTMHIDLMMTSEILFFMAKDPFYPAHRHVYQHTHLAALYPASVETDRWTLTALRFFPKAFQ